MDDKERIKELENKLKQSVSLEDAITTKVYKDSIELIKKWAGGYLILVTIILAAFGYSTWRDIDKTIKDFSKSKVEIELQTELDTLKKNIITSLHENSINYTNEFDEDLAKIFDDTKRDLEFKLQVFADNASKDLNRPELAKGFIVDTRTKKKEKGFAYYGIYNNGKWEEKNFKNISQGESEYPTVGDQVEALLPVNSRVGVIEFREGKGWQNQKLIGSISLGETVKILKVQPVASGNYIWIEFEKY